MFWRLNRIQFPVYNLGPGKRLGIWVQGCSLACEGCINPELWNRTGGRNVEIAALAYGILESGDSFDGITITGGEPFEQYEALMAFCSFIKMKSTLNIMVYSGFTLDELMVKFPDKLFSQTLDYLIDGRYVKPLAKNDNLRGSSNQNFYTFEDGKFSIVNDNINNEKWSVALTKTHEVFMAGVPKKEDIKSLTEHLKKSGITLKFDEV